MNNKINSAPNRKKDEVLEIATKLFLEKGYEGASINEMSRRSGISKETVYRHFKNKEQLFAAVIDHELEGFWAALNPLNFEHSEMDMKDVLIKAGSNMIRQLTLPETLALRRIIFFESAHKLEIGKLYFERGPESTYKQLAKYFDVQRAKGYVSHVGSRAMSEYLVAMLLHKLTLIQFCGVEIEFSEKKIARLVRKIVDDFIKSFFLSIAD